MKAIPRMTGTTALWVVAVVAVTWWLRAAHTLLVPIALAVCISYALEPVVAWLSRFVPRLLAATVLMCALAAAVGWGAYSLRDDASTAIAALPQVARRIHELVSGDGKSEGPAASLKQATEALQGSDGETGRRGTSSGPTTAAAQLPLSAGLLQRGMGSAFSLLGDAVTIVFLVFFLLAAGDHFSRRLIEVADDAEKKEVTAGIIRDINDQIQRFLLVRAFTGAVVAAATWGALAMLGTPQAAVWGILAGVFNSIPYFGPVIVSGGLLIVGLVQSGNLMKGLEMAGVALVITSLEGWVLTPPLLGKAERMSAAVIFLGLLFWTWVWGAWGTLLAVPMLVVIKSVADRVDRLRPLSRLMAP